MPFESEAQRRFMYSQHPKLAKEFEKATPEGADLPEHVKKEHMADGGMPVKEGDEFTEGLKEGINHDSDAVQSYLKSKFNQLLGSEPTPNMTEGGKVERSSLEHPEPNAMMARPMAEGGVWLQNESKEGVDKATHVEGMPANVEKPLTETGTNMAEGGAIHEAEGRDKEPAKPADINMGDKEKLNAIYKAMGMDKYAVGGMVPTAPPAGPDLGMPAQADPTYWDQVKAALAKIGAPLSPLAKPGEMASGISNAVTPVVAPAAVSAINNLAGTSLPIPEKQAPKIEDLGTPTPLAASLPPAMPPMAAPAGIPAGKPTTGAPDLKNLFNQDTSKLTEGFNAEDRQALADKTLGAQHGMGSVVAQALAGLGDALATKGGREQHALKDIFGLQKVQRDEALANFDKGRQARLEKLDLQTKMGNNTINQLAAQDAYGVDEHLNKMLGAPPGTLHKDLPLYMQMTMAKVAQQEKLADLTLKAHDQAAKEVDEAEKGASFFHIKISPEQRYAKIAQKAEQYVNGAQGNVSIKRSNGQIGWIPAANLDQAKKIDPGIQVMGQ